MSRAWTGAFAPLFYRLLERHALELAILKHLGCAFTISQAAAVQSCAIAQPA